jgi:hypothetical protein
MPITTSGKDFYKDGKKIRFAGDHTWNTVQEMNGKRIRIDRITGNTTKLWTNEIRGAVFSQSQWGSNTPGFVRISNVPWKKDGSLNGKFYRSLEKAVKKADKRDMVTGVSLFEGSMADLFPQAWENHAFNGLGPKSHEQVHTRGPWNKYQRAHVRRVVKTLEKYDNVIYEVGNELMSPSTKWFQGQVVKWVRKWSSKPVGVSYARGIRASRGQNEAAWMQRTGADWFAPTMTALTAGQFDKIKKPIILDTDHSWALRSNVPGLQNAWDRGYNIWLMAGFRGTMLRDQQSLTPDRNLISRLLGQ